MDRAPAELRKLIADTSRSQLGAAWAEELAAGGGTAAQRRFVADDNTVIPHSNGLIVKTGGSILTMPYEFGTDAGETFTRYTRTNPSGSGSHQVNRRTKRQLPARRAGGWLAFPAANRLGSRVFKMWGALINKVAHDALEGR